MTIKLKIQNTKDIMEVDISQKRLSIIYYISSLAAATDAIIIIRRANRFVIHNGVIEDL